MTTLTEPGVDPASALDSVFDRQRAAFTRNPHPPAAERRAHLDLVIDLLKRHGDEIAAAIDADFGHRAIQETRLLEIFPSLQGARHARSHVARWMRPERKPVSIWFLPGRGRVVKQPLGVVGVIVPWNYPLSLALGPLVSALAAGNRVMIKMSEYTPRTGELLQRLLAARFDADHIAVINGGVEVGQAFAAKPFDHLLFTGSTAVGREVMRAAAENLTPVTLELGGKSPVIVTPDFPVDVAARRIMLGKCLNAGQSCVAPDYVLVPEQAMPAFIDAAHAEVGRLYPAGIASPDYSSIITARHYQRVTGYLADAQAQGAWVMPLAEGGSAATRKIPPTILTDVTDAMAIMREEIFGPLLPLIPYRSLEEAVAFVTARPRPLALYVFDYDRTRTRRLMGETIAGAVTINDTMLHFAQDALPFGGVGPSGMGQYHGEEGFTTFSKRKGMFIQSRLNGLWLLKPPFGPRVERMLRLMLR